ncbi:hypothetical protein QOZ80_2BG0164560 [Eleusine coracana subsp. coracana]|nr:hypothetical protein QOZ80_2BG0164560 [Eleusine coracana subsp. coracana]
MPRPRRHAARSASSPYKKKIQRVISPAAVGGDTGLPDDVLADIFSRLPHTADVVRCAATCSLWARAVAARAADLSRALPPMGRFVPELAVGLFHQEQDGPTPRTRRRSRTGAARPPCFLPLASGFGRRTGSLLALDGGSGDEVLNCSRPVASRNGRLVLELRRASRADGLAFCVCNPITGDAAVLPELTGDERPTDYGCALLTGDDLDHPRRCNTKFFFRLLLIYNRPRFTTVLRCYSSDTGRWETEVTSSVKVSTWELHHMGPSVVRRGVAFWPLDHGALGVRLGDHDQLDRAADVHLLPYNVPSHRCPEKRLLGVSPDDGRLFFLHLSIRMGLNVLSAKISYFDIPGDDDISAGRKESSSFEQAVMMHQMKIEWWDNIDSVKLRWVGEKSGVVLFTMGQGSTHDGTFALSLRDGTVEKVAAGEGDSWRNMLGFEMDGAMYLASLLPRGEN